MLREVKRFRERGRRATTRRPGSRRPFPAALALLAAATPGVSMAEQPADGLSAQALVSRMVVEPLIPIGEGADRWIVPPGGTGSSERFLCSVVFEVVEVLDTEAGVAISESVPEGLLYLPGSATGPGARIELSTDAGRTYRPEDEVAAEDGPVTHVRWVLNGPVAAGMRGRVSFRARLADGPSTHTADR